MVLKRLPVTRRRRFSHEAETGQLRYARACCGGRVRRASATNVRYRRGSIDGPLPGSNPTPDLTTKRTAATQGRRARRAFGSIVDKGFFDFLLGHIGIFFSIPRNRSINDNPFFTSLLSSLQLSVPRPAGHKPLKEKSQRSDLIKRV